MGQREALTEEYRKSGYGEVCREFTREEDFVIMRDGVGLHTFIFKPKDLGRESFPVILQRSCYPSHAEALEIHGVQMAKRGYAFVFQFCRGIEESQGKWTPNVNERNDGIDTVRWLAGQPWTENIGYWGCSYLAAAGWAMADAVSPYMTSMALTHYGTDRFKSAYEKGMFRQDVLTSWSMQNCGWEVKADYDQVCRYMPQKEVDTALWGGEVPWYREYVCNTRKEEKYWQQGWWQQLDEIPGRVQIPLLIAEGWYDHHLGSALEAWNKLNPISKRHSRLIIGPWNHGFEVCIQGQKTDHGKNSEIQMILEWFEQTLKRKELPCQEVRTYQIGEDKWQKTEHKVQREREETAFYLSFGGDSGQGSLTVQEKNQEGKASYIYDPDHPVKSWGSESCLYSWGSIGSLLQPSPGWRDDVLTFISDPLTEDLRIFGRMQAELWVSSDCEDTSFTAKVMRVTPEGEAYNIRSSIASLSHGSQAGEAYVPHTRTQVKIDMWDVCYTVKKGERLRLDISSSNYPEYHIHCNYRGIWGEQARKRKAFQTVFGGGETPSCLRIETWRT